MSSFTLNYRASTKGTHCEGSLYVRVIHERKSATVTMPYRLYPQEWDPLNRCINFDRAHSFRLKYLHEIDNKIQSDKEFLIHTINRLHDQGSYTLEDILAGYRLKDTVNLLSLYMEQQADKLHSGGQERTAKAYRSAVKSLIKYNGGKDLSLGDINARLIKNYESFLKEDGKSLNTISFYMRNLRAIYYRAVRDRCIELCAEDPFRQVYTGVQITRKRALNKQEINSLNNLIFIENKNILGDKTSNPGLRFALDIFLFCFYARGMPFVDLAYLRKENIEKGVLAYFRRKTGQLIEVKVTPPMQKIIDRYSSQIEETPYVFPIIKDNSKSTRIQYESALRLQNLRLKKLALLAKVNKKLTTHVTRHSWATIAKSENLPLWVISEGLGHANEKTTYTYLASFERSVLDRANARIMASIGNSR